ncbi:hypothetical protein PGT21_030292 [Puccinia graminis f. sp. tritici]|uniref:Uncharacterized protein n=1 Tax=Puccinia graminis f. sp. tritici TaxID=56615 RepID=A0A5B0PLX4_PUCGR|nr:hypothetical protein PGT21_030292 [Puccinia graminis f. sp. tritici]
MPKASGGRYTPEECFLETQVNTKDVPREPSHQGSHPYCTFPFNSTVLFTTAALTFGGPGFAGGAKISSDALGARANSRAPQWTLVDPSDRPESTRGENQSSSEPSEPGRASVRGRTRELRVVTGEWEEITGPRGLGLASTTPDRPKPRADESEYQCD